jgi:hypothetical protein
MPGLDHTRSAHAAVLLPEGDVLLIGGRVIDISPDIVRFHAATRTFFSAGVLDQARVSLTATLLSNRTVLVAGGAGPAGDLDTAEVFELSRRHAVAHQR